MRPTLDRAWAVFIARALLGMVFFIGGAHKVFTLGATEHARTLFVEPYANTYLPVWALWVTGMIVPYLELVFGALVLIGLFTRVSLMVLGAILVFVMFGHLVRAPLFVANGFILPRAGLFLFVLLMPRELDWFSVDGLLRSRRPSGSPAPPAFKEAV
jgi:thiosulfate dehydrogenase [quinone] large subunit